MTDIGTLKSYWAGISPIIHICVVSNWNYYLPGEKKKIKKIIHWHKKLSYLLLWKHGLKNNKKSASGLIRQIVEGLPENLMSMEPVAPYDDLIALKGWSMIKQPSMGHRTRVSFSSHLLTALVNIGRLLCLASSSARKKINIFPTFWEGCEVSYQVLW